jgi:dipeptidyl aminopeptidase/acylaminoacyl peptidase
VEEKRAFVAKDLFRHRVIASLEGAPTYDCLAFKLSRALRKEDSYERTLWGLRAGDGAPRPLTSVAFSASYPRWNSDASTLAFLSDRGKGTQIQLLAMHGGEATSLTKTKKMLSSIEAWSPGGDRLLVSVTEQCNEDGEPDSTPKGQRPPDVARYLPYKKDGSGITTGTRTHLYSVSCADGELTAITGGDFDVKLGRWSPDGERLAYVRTRSGRQRHRTDIWIAAADGSDARPLIEELASVSEVAWSPDGRWLAVAAGEAEGDSMVRLWLVDAGNGWLRALADEDFELDPVSGVVWHRDGDRVAVVSTRGSLQEIAVVDIASGEATHLHGGLRQVTGLAAFGDRLAFVAASMRKLDEVYSVEWDGSDEQRHSAFNRGWFRKRSRPRVTLRHMEATDGDGVSERIDAWLLRPAQGEGPFPLLVDMHGGPHSTVLMDFASHTYWYELCSKGWAILAPNAVGSGGFGRHFAHRLQGRWGELDLPQFESLIRRLQDEGIADDRVVCTGKSYGGFLSAWAVGHSDLFKAAIVCAPVTNITSHFGTSDTGYYVTPFAMGGEVHEVRERYDALSPISHCVNVTAAVLILQGENDGRCPRGQSEELFANLIRCTQAPAELVVYPTSTHSEAESGRPSNRVDYHGRIAAWAERWTRRDEASPAR